MKLNTVIPNHLHKRGLLDLLGTWVKCINVTVDDYDRQNIEKHLGKTVN